VLELAGTQTVETVLVTAVVLARHFDARAFVRPIVEIDGRRVRITCRDGQQFFVQLVAAERIDEPFGDRPLRGHVRFARIDATGQRFVFEESTCT
jgi:hypothetical protein